MHHILLCCWVALAAPTLSAAEAAMAGKPIHHADTPAEAQGRRTLSTAFARVGPDGYLTVELRDGHALVLRGVQMRAADYCGERAGGGKPYCGRYDDVAGARPGGGPAPRDHAAELDPVVR
ncbi:hypothetical protein HRV97_16730 [Sphingomonas sp. HHU CXW]|uniref:Secreted protein n=1 Tax=Sphingomonas hominis TaxID=2741495 RepID=A0ABX2JK52_9SPHN|nr:hypothetical protein [Sphingomonas hominis]NTS66787.1 hypothetical protein [Sphingomonas hominis]